MVGNISILVLWLLVHYKYNKKMNEVWRLWVARCEMRDWKIWRWGFDAAQPPWKVMEWWGYEGWRMRDEGWGMRDEGWRNGGVVMKNPFPWAFLRLRSGWQWRDFLFYEEVGIKLLRSFVLWRVILRGRNWKSETSRDIIKYF